MCIWYDLIFNINFCDTFLLDSIVWFLQSVLKMKSAEEQWKINEWTMNSEVCVEDKFVTLNE